jgi:hypothetical protein
MIPVEAYSQTIRDRKFKDKAPDSTILQEEEIVAQQKLTKISEYIISVRSIQSTEAIAEGSAAWGVRRDSPTKRRNEETTRAKKTSCWKRYGLWNTKLLMSRLTSKSTSCCPWSLQWRLSPASVAPVLAWERPRG